MLRSRRTKMLDKNKEQMVSSDSALVSSAKALEAAFEIANYNRDIDAMVAISDRWLNMWKMIGTEHRIPIGFTNISEEDVEYNNS